MDQPGTVGDYQTREGEEGESDGEAVACGVPKGHNGGTRSIDAVDYDRGGSVLPIAKLPPANQRELAFGSRHTPTESRLPVAPETRLHLGGCRGFLFTRSGCTATPSL